MSNRVKTKPCLRIHDAPAEDSNSLKYLKNAWFLFLEPSNPSTPDLEKSGSTPMTQSVSQLAERWGALQHRGVGKAPINVWWGLVAIHPDGRRNGINTHRRRSSSVAPNI